MWGTGTDSTNITDSTNTSTHKHGKKRGGVFAGRGESHVVGIYKQSTNPEQ